VSCGTSSSAATGAVAATPAAATQRATKTPPNQRIISAHGRKRLRPTMNGILGQQVAERTALFRPGRSTAQVKQAGTMQNSQQSTPAAVHRVHSAPTKRPEPVCILGCCGFGKISILWTVSIIVIVTIVINVIIYFILIIYLLSAP